MEPAERRSGPLPPHFVYRSFLGEADHRALLERTLASESLLTASRLSDRQVHVALRKSRSVSLTPLPSSGGGGAAPVATVRDMLVAALERLMPDIFARAGLKPFPVSRIELELVAYGDGALFQTHSDVTRPGSATHSDRLLTGICYFHAEPKGFSGGALRLHRFGAADGSAGSYVDIEPEQNSLLVFPSWATHEVRRVSCPGGSFRDSRFAVNCWLHRAR